MVWAACFVGASVMLACAGSNTKSEAPASPAPADTSTTSPEPSPGAGAPAAPPQAQAAAVGSASPAAPHGDGASTASAASSGAKTQRPFAATAQEATEYIDEAVETRHGDVEKCVAAARDRRKSPHLDIVVELGIDQEGTLIGVKGSKGTPQDKVLFDCIRDALLGAPFPRSKAGVITLKKTFSDQVIR